ncbi:glycosyltransferase [Egbenema bharatensis]|uniref:glycosyltransferase n=1 Tax=Egbenema bharatensis TaxID=3463334 RepID=UPI003A8B022B
MPVYNGEDYLSEAIQSVINQTYSEWKLLLIDDCSTDRSRDIIEQFSGDSRISKLYHANNCGLYGSLVKAVSHINSEWIVILMQDDRLKPGYLEEMFSIVKHYPESKAFWATEDLIDRDGQMLRKGSETSRIEVINPGISPWLSILRRGCIWTISGSLTHRSLFLSDPFRIDLPHCGDYDWLLRTIRREIFVYYEKALTEIRIHEKQASTSNLKSGQDIKEYHSIINNNLCNYSQEISQLKTLHISLQWAKAMSLRMISSFLKGNLYYAAFLGWYTLKFLSLPFTYKRMNNATNT